MSRFGVAWAISRLRNIRYKPGSGARIADGRSFRVLPAWAVLLGLVMAASAIGVTVSVLLNEAGHAKIDQRPALRIEAIKTGLAVGAGVGALAALLLSARKQWLEENAHV